MVDKRYLQQWYMVNKRYLQQWYIVDCKHSIMNQAVAQISTRGNKEIKVWMVSQQPSYEILTCYSVEQKNILFNQSVKVRVYKQDKLNQWWH